MGIVSYNGVHVGHVDGQLQGKQSEDSRASRHKYFGGERLGSNTPEGIPSLPADDAPYGNVGDVSHHTKFGNVNAHHADIAAVQIVHPGLLSPASLPISSPTVTPEQSSVITTEGIRLAVEGMKVAVNEQDEIPPQRSLSKKPSPLSSLNLTLESQTTVYGEPDSKIHYQPPPMLPMETPSLPRVASNVRTPQEADLERVKKLRRRVKMLRFQVQSHRAQVQLKQAAKSRADEQYMEKVRTRHVTEQTLATTDDSELRAFEDLWKKCQIARDQYGPAEVELSEMEDRLEYEEEKLERAEERFYEQLYERNLPVLILPPDHESRHSGSSSNVSTTQVTEHESIYDEYLGRLGDQDILQERYEALFNERNALEEEQERRRGVGTDLDAEDLDFLANFADLRESTGKELKEVSDDVEILRQKCIEQGVLDRSETSSPQFLASELPTPAMQAASGTLMKVELQTELAPTPSKLSQPQTLPENNNVDSRIVFGDAGHGNFIDTWLLDKLRSSTIEILQLAAYVAATGLRMMDMQNWQTEALRLWYSDNTDGDSDVDNAAKVA